MSRPVPSAATQRGIVMVTSLLLLVVVTIIALSMFRSFGIQEKIAGNMREKQRALQAAISTQQYAENWLGANAATAPVNCANLLNARLSQGQICSNKLAATVGGDVTNVPWRLGGAAAGALVGVMFTPDGMTLSTTNSAATASASNPSYYGAPTFYIADLGVSADPNIPGEIYQVDAVAYGGSSGTAAVVESTYAVYTSSTCRSCQ
jgi:type IV pilus assembly protein PilX